VHSENGQRHLTLFHSHLSGDVTKPGQDMIDTVFCRMPMAATGNPADGPATINRAPDLAYVYTRTSAGHLIQRRWDGSAWLRTDLGGAMRTAPSAAEDSAAETRAFNTSTTPTTCTSSPAPPPATSSTPRTPTTPGPGRTSAPDPWSGRE
jgi:hypothetical protein